ncbi:MAG: hypothetical protein D6E12_06820 [Desulfovibrio sp.]|nr:MAG: hypothetical protein D6E12_06820 [Desulfovibrio sp.]
MKNQYTADITDYRTYGLLRVLCGQGGLSLGVNWMLTPNDGRSDGSKLAYLKDPATWRPYDSELFDAMARIIERDDRNVAAVENANLLPNTAFFSKLLPDTAEPRGRFMAQALDKLSDRDLLFLDPDNGMEVASTPLGAKNSSKYLYFTEISQAYDRGHSLIIFQYFPRVDRESYITRRAEELRGATGSTAIYSLATSLVCFFVVARETHAPELAARLSILSHQWGEQFTISLYDPLGL